MKKQIYIKNFKSENKALDWMKMKNRACQLAGNKRDIFCVVDGPCDNFAVVDLRTAIELESGYKIEY